MPHKVFFSAPPEIGDIWPDKVVQALPSSLGLKDACEKYAVMRSVLAAIAREPKLEVPERIQGIAADTSRRLSTLCGEIAGRDLSDSRVAEKSAQDFVGNVAGDYDAILEHVRPHIRSDVHELADRLKRADQIEQRLTRAQDQVQALQDKADELLVKITVGGQAAHFKTEANRQRRAAQIWLAAVVVAGLGLAGVVIWLLVETENMGGPDGFSWESVATMLASKALAIGVFSWMVSFCSRNYRSHRHLEATYRQRMSAVNT